MRVERQAKEAMRHLEVREQEKLETRADRQTSNAAGLTAYSYLPIFLDLCVSTNCWLWHEVMFSLKYAI